MGKAHPLAKAFGKISNGFGHDPGQAAQSGEFLKPGLSGTGIADSLKPCHIVKIVVDQHVVV